MWSKIKIESFGFVLFISLAVLPLIGGLSYALLYSLGIIGAIADGFTLQYWAQVLASSEIFYSFAYSFYIAIISILLSVSGAFGLLFIFKEAPSRSLPTYALYLPLAIPAIVSALLIYQFLGKGGYFSSLFFQLGVTDSIQQFPDLINDTYGIGIIAAHVLLATPFFTILFLNIYKNERIAELSQLAVTIGSNASHYIRRVVVPLILKKSTPTIILYFIFVLGSYEIPLLLGQQSPQMVSVLAIRKLRRFNLQDIPEAYIIALLYVTLVLCFVLYLFKKRRLAHDL